MSYSATLPIRTLSISPAYDYPLSPAGRARGYPTSTPTQRSLRQHIAGEPQHPPHTPRFGSPFKYIPKSCNPRSPELSDRWRPRLSYSTGVPAPQTTIKDTLTKQRRLRMTRWPITPEFHSSSHRVNASTGTAERHERSECVVEDLATRSDANGMWCPVCGGLLGVACSGHHARVEVDGGG